MDKKWATCNPDNEQPIYSHVYNCIYAPIIGSLNDWGFFTFDN